MPAVTIYTGSFCGPCIRAKSLLDRRGISYTEVNVEHHPGLQQELLTRSGRRTLPQVYVNETCVGGAEELAALDLSGELLKLVQPKE